MVNGVDHTTLSATNGEAAIKMTERKMPAPLLVDVKMPVMHAILVQSPSIE